jgi:hypothetical protein
MPEEDGFLYVFVLEANARWDYSFRLDNTFSTISALFYFFLGPSSRLLSPSMPLIKALQRCDKLLFLVVNPGFYCLVIS